MPQIARTPEEIAAKTAEAQKVSFAQEDAGEDNDVAEAVYQFGRWVLGDTDEDPMSHVGDPEDYE